MRKAHQAVLELAGREVVITNPDKPFFPQAGHTKLQLVRYYAAVAEGALRGRAHVDLPTGFVLHDEMMQEDPPADRVTVFLHTSDRNLDPPPGGGDVERRAHQIGAVQSTAARR